jgi:glycosyltransferase involved in cell wall biosynthesis
MKGIEYFLAAAALVSQRFPDVRFVIAGDGNNRRELEEYAATLGLASKALFTGFRTDLAKILPEAAVSVLPSLSEGLSNSLLESMAAGVPVVATNVGGNPEIVEDGISGLLVPPRDSEALATAMIRVLTDTGLAARFGLAGRNRVREMFSMQRSVDSVERLYNTLVQEATVQEQDSI